MTNPTHDIDPFGAEWLEHKDQTLALATIRASKNEAPVSVWTGLTHMTVVFTIDDRDPDTLAEDAPEGFEDWELCAIVFPNGHIAHIG